MIIEQLKKALEYLFFDFPKEARYEFSAPTLKLLKKYYMALVNFSYDKINDLDEIIQLLEENANECQIFFEYGLIKLIIDPYPDMDVEEEVRRYCQGYMSQWEIIKQAYIETVSTLTHSESMAYIENPRDEIKISKVTEILDTVREEEGEIPVQLNHKVKNTQNYYLKTLMLAKKYNVGNCDEMTNFFIYLLAKKGFYGQAEYFYFEKLDHCFCVLNRLPTSNDDDFKSWGPDCLIVDPWARKIYPASEISHYLTGIDLELKKLVAFDPSEDKLLSAPDHSAIALYHMNHDDKVELLEENISCLTDLLYKISVRHAEFINIYSKKTWFFSQPKQASELIGERISSLNQLIAAIRTDIRKFENEKKIDRDEFVDLMGLKENLDNKLITYSHQFNQLSKLYKENFKKQQDGNKIFRKLGML